MSNRALVSQGLAALGKRRLLLAIFGESFPADPDEDFGVGAPGTRAAERLFAYARELGFTGLQLGPSGETPRDVSSPYDGTVFSRGVTSIPAAAFRPGGSLEGWVPSSSVDARAATTGERADHRRAHDGVESLVAEAWANVLASGDPRGASMLARLDGFSHDHAAWLERDALFDALARMHASMRPADWASAGADPLDAHLFSPAQPASDAARRERRDAILRASEVSRRVYAFTQMIAHAEHARVRERARAYGLHVYADMQVGFAPADAWSYEAAFLPGYYLGAPPSRTNPEGQPWHYPVLDPTRFGDRANPGPVLDLVRRRVEKVFSEYEGLRIDHPHGLVCPWVYRADALDPGVAVRQGARLYDSPDLPDHPALGALAIARSDQLDRSLPRYADGWVRELDDDQVARYSRLLDVILERARSHGRDPSDVSCEVLSTLPYPLARVLERHGLGRWRITQKADLDRPADVYRSENARPEDWVMLGNHDTASIWALLRRWDDAKRAQWARHVATRLRLGEAGAGTFARAPGLLATAMLAELFVSEAAHVLVFFADLFGIDERFNAPGTVSPENWSVRLAPSFEATHRDKIARGEALDLPLAVALAIRARGAAPELARALFDQAGPAKAALGAF